MQRIATHLLWTTESLLVAVDKTDIYFKPTSPFQVLYFLRDSSKLQKVRAEARTKQMAKRFEKIFYWSKCCVSLRELDIFVSGTANFGLMLRSIGECLSRLESLRFVVHLEHNPRIEMVLAASVRYLKSIPNLTFGKFRDDCARDLILKGLRGGQFLYLDLMQSNTLYGTNKFHQFQKRFISYAIKMNVLRINMPALRDDFVMKIARLTFGSP